MRKKFLMDCGLICRISREDGPGEKRKEGLSMIFPEDGVRDLVFSRQDFVKEANKDFWGKTENCRSHCRL